MNKKCCVLLTSHKFQLTDDEERSFLQALKVFGGKRDIKVVIPNNISTEYYDKYCDKVELCKVNSEWMKSTSAYNYMLCNREFWSLFNEYDYVLTYQTDCWVFEDRLDYFINLGFDYYGAPWPHHSNTIGNGGFSLRKVSKMIELTTKYTFRGESLLHNEDTWFCQNHKNELNLCDLETACNFSIESPTKVCNRLIKDIPMGLHGKLMIKYWDEDGSRFLTYKNNNL